MPFLFLSPSTQAGNPYVTEGNERLWMNRIADRMEPYLRASGINVTRNDPEGTVGTSIRASNAGNYDFHLALHSNAAPPQSAGTVRGIDLYYYPGSTDGLRMANILADNLREIYPLPQRVRPLASTSITEIRRVRAPSVLAELGYHDNRADAEWIENNLEAIARSLTLSSAHAADLRDGRRGQRPHSLRQRIDLAQIIRQDISHPQAVRAGGAGLS